jgi:hypothetical protein
MSIGTSLIAIRGQGCNATRPKVAKPRKFTKLTGSMVIAQDIGFESRGNDMLFFQSISLKKMPPRWF